MGLTTIESFTSSKVVMLNRVQPMIEFDRDGKILSANESFQRLLGYTLDELRDEQKCLYVVPEGFWEEVCSGSIKTSESQNIAKDGSEVWIRTSYHRLADDAGNLARVIGMISDISEEMRYKDSRMGDALVVEYNPDGSILYANDAFLALTGYTLTELVGRHHCTFVSGAEARSTDYYEFWENLRAGMCDAGEYSHSGKGGRRFWLQASYRPVFDAHGNLCKIVQQAVDITAGKEEFEGLRIDTNAFWRRLQARQAEQSPRANALWIEAHSDMPRAADEQEDDVILMPDAAVVSNVIDIRHYRKQLTAK